jgi:hypothetical protein
MKIKFENPDKDQLQMTTWLNNLNKRNWKSSNHKTSGLTVNFLEHTDVQNLKIRYDRSNDCKSYSLKKKVSASFITET